jgi:ribosomal protein S18 acetylase RimI-like enzyme
MSGVGLREVATDDDVAAVAVLVGEYSSWVREVLLRNFGITVDYGAGTEALFTELATVLKPPGRLYLATLNGTGVGTVGLKHIHHTVAELKRMYVLPSARGRGVGRRLMERILLDAKAGGYAVVRLETMNWMIDALALYRRFGFREIQSYGAREFEDVRAVDELAVFMELALPTESQTHDDGPDDGSRHGGKLSTRPHSTPSTRNRQV